MAAGAAPERPIGVEMAKLIYAAIASLDGYVEDEEGRFDWAAPDVRDDGVLGDREQRGR